MLMQVITVLSWLALPVALVCIVDDWFLRPRRQISAAQPIADPPLMATLYLSLPVFVVAGIIRLLAAEQLDFSLVLVLIAAVTGVFWLLDVLLFRRQRAAAALAAGKDPNAIPEPGTADYARSFFPVVVVVLALRAFVFEPFRIPSDSMMPTLLDGDFIIVNKYAYGLRLPVLNKKFVAIGEPGRGDVVVFRYPPNPQVNYIKRLVGLPGDHVQVRDDKLIVNGVPVATTDRGLFDDGCYQGLHLAEEQLGTHHHQIMFCPTPGDISVEPLPGCDRHQLTRGYVCVEPQGPGLPDRNDFSEITVPPGHYFMIGDNRDNSADGRVWGFVPEENLVGKATRIWLNFDLQRTRWVKWNRIGMRIE